MERDGDTGPQDKVTMFRSMFLALMLAMMLSGTLSNARAEVKGRTALAPSREASHQRISTMQIRIKVGDRVLMATLENNATVRDFVSLLPLSLTLKDYASTEKISDLPRKLSEEGAPAGIDPSIGDITYYAPWGNLAIFYRDFGYSKGLIKLGTIVSGLEALNQPGSLSALIQPIE
jgi:hypothetical protein